MARLIVSIDGPAGTGKSTVSRGVARHLGLPHLDTGAFYRAATLAALRDNSLLDDETTVLAAVRAHALEQRQGRMYLDGEDVSDEIRGPIVSGSVSLVSAYPKVRAELVELQRSWVERNGGSAVVEGRDIGSVVFPDAEVKVYLDAAPEVRAERRAKDTGQGVDTVRDEHERRDRTDSTRDASPMQIPEGAPVIDTSYLEIDEVIEEIVRLATSR